LLLAGCGSGQTGSPDCVGPTSCVCDPLYAGGTLLRVHAERSAAGKLEASVDAVLGSVYGVAPDVELGERIGGSVLLEQPCARGASSDSLPGAELLVLYSPGNTDGYPNCAAFQACAAADCAKLDEPALTECWNTCASQTETSCAEQRRAALLDGVFSFAIPWTEPLSFGGSSELSQAELDVLSSPETCLQHFPASPAPPCQDTQIGTCTVTPARAVDHHPGAWSALLGLLALLYGARRFRR
jgi:hypothetical protein